MYKSYPWNSNYAFAENRVIDGIDLEGLEYTSYQATEMGTAAIEAGISLASADYVYDNTVTKHLSLIHI